VLEIVLFGPPSVRVTGGDALPVRPSAMALLASLVLDGPRPQSRDLLAARLNADVTETLARRRLSTSLWRLRRELPSGGGGILSVTPGEVGMKPDDVWVDVTDFETRVRPVLAAPVEAMDDAAAKALGDAVTLYRGDLLEGTYDDWVLRERDRLADEHLAALARLVVWYEGRDAPAALRYAKLVLDRDPLREDAHRAVMRAYADLGRRSDAVRQYESCVRLLDVELGLPPLPETTALAAAISAGRDHATPAAPVPAADVATRLRELSAHLETLRDEVLRVVDELERPR
jgi:DNA-binding SARP family transcriptional activator